MTISFCSFFSFCAPDLDLCFSLSFSDLDLSFFFEFVFACLALLLSCCSWEVLEQSRYW